jgi:hypothetical protein
MPISKEAIAVNVFPNLVYIGPDKAGSTWLFGLLAHHPDVYVTPAKDLYFFDRFYDKGLGWYASQFAAGVGKRVVAEISHDYLYAREAAARIKRDLPDARLLVCLREPCERTFSGYLHLIKSGRCSGSFEQALQEFPGLVERSLYGKHLAMYLEYFDRERLCYTLFDDLQADSKRFADQLFVALGLSPVPLPEGLREKALPAGRSRSVLLTQLVRKAADIFRRAGLPKVVGRIKTSPLVQRLLYAPYADEPKPQLSGQLHERLQAIFAPDVALLDETLGTNLARRWGYSAEPPLPATDGRASKALAPAHCTP